ncbi:MAG TPA: TonB family protein [Candidatus Acidoferrum sp.]|nr:TonB family protein [Candidatus Acidoferrum sp.]
MTTPLDPRPVTKAPAAAPGAAPNGDPRGAGPIPMEIPIVATGARQGGGSGPRELFCEDTTTVLVFEKGAVIRLSVAVVPGQLIFLTNLQTKKEVVAQAMLKRSTQRNNSFAELQFTEESPNFWGVDFSKTQAVAATVPGALGMGVPRDEEIAAEHPPLELAAPAAEEVEKLREEVETLRRKLASLAHAPAQPHPAAQDGMAVQPPVQTTQQSVATGIAGAPGTEELTAALLTVATSPAKPAVAPAQRSHEESAGGVSPTALGAALLAATTAPVEPSAARVRDSLPTMVLPKAGSAGENSGSHSRADEELGSLVHQGEVMDGEGEVLPEASLDFDGTLPTKPGRKARGKTELGMPASGEGMGKLRLAFLCGMMFLCTAGAMWYEQWLPGVIAARLPTPESLFSIHGTASVAPRSKPTPVPANKPKPLPVAMHAGAEANRSTGTAGTAPAESAKPTEEEAKERVGEDAPAKKVPEAHRRARTEKESSIGSEAGLPPANAVASPDPALAKDTVVPPKLLKSVRPEAPAQAIRSYVTGNVEVDALVSAEGRVASAEALSGPKVLQDAAIATVKQYKYAPATRGGKAVAAHVKVTVQFWYEP